MFELEKNEQIIQLINITKSNSGISGPELAIAHMKLGKELAKHIDMNPTDTTIVAVLRGGIFFAEGMYLQMGCKFDVFNPKTDHYCRPQTKNVILVDSVVNTGNTLCGLLDDNTYIACCVINEKAVQLFTDKLFTVRISQNSFVGSNTKQQKGNKGPDTTMRLFNQL